LSTHNKRFFLIIKHKLIIKWFSILKNSFSCVCDQTIFICVFFFLWCPGFESHTLHILCIICTNCLNWWKMMLLLLIVCEIKIIWYKWCWVVLVMIIHALGVDSCVVMFKLWWFYDFCQKGLKIISLILMNLN